MTIGSKWPRERIEAVAASGIHITEAVKVLGIERNYLGILLSRYGIRMNGFVRRGKVTGEDVLLPEPKTHPPSRALINLAQFDPVFARVLRDRLGLPSQKEGEESANPPPPK